MIDALKKMLDETGKDRSTRIHLLREYLQLLILKLIDEKKYGDSLAFMGGTALRILHHIKRYSEDLDFSFIASKNKNKIDTCFEKLVGDLRKHSFQIEFKKNVGKTVALLDIKFDGLLYALDLSPLKTQRLSIKVRVDQNPPKGFVCKKTILEQDGLFSVSSFDLPTLMAGKLHAFLFRPYTKGRDYYDLLWFFTKKIEPNFTYLNHAAKQTQAHAVHFDLKTLEQTLIEKIQKTNFKDVLRDVEPFLMVPAEARLFNPKDFVNFAKRYFMDKSENI
jgi:predicted nucleotidyltransferase component of viral defense system